MLKKIDVHGEVLSAARVVDHCWGFLFGQSASARPVPLWQPPWRESANTCWPVKTIPPGRPACRRSPGVPCGAQIARGFTSRECEADSRLDRGHGDRASEGDERAPVEAPLAAPCMSAPGRPDQRTV